MQWEGEGFSQGLGEGLCQARGSGLHATYPQPRVAPGGSGWRPVHGELVMRLLEETVRRLSPHSQESYWSSLTSGSQDST